MFIFYNERNLVHHISNTHTHALSYLAFPLTPNQQTFVDNQTIDKKYKVIAFGGGVSKCPGRFLAVREIKHFLLLALTRYEWILPASCMKKQKKQPLQEGEKVSALPFDESRLGLGIYPPKDDFNVVLKKRKGKN
jgi:hypothetical protein